MPHSAGFGSWFPLPSLVASNSGWIRDVATSSFMGAPARIASRTWLEVGLRASLPHRDQPSAAVPWSHLLPHVASVEKMDGLPPSWSLAAAALPAPGPISPGLEELSKGGFTLGSPGVLEGPKAGTVQGSLQVPASCKLSWAPIRRPCRGRCPSWTWGSVDLLAEAHRSRVGGLCFWNIGI